MNNEQFKNRQIATLVSIVCATVHILMSPFISDRYLLRSQLLDRQSQRLLDRQSQRLSFINGIIYRSDIECHNQTHMSRIAFHALQKNLASSGLLKSTRGVSIDEQLLIFLHILGHNVRNRPLRYYLGRFGETVSRHFNRVLKAIISLYPEYVKPPKPDCIEQMPIHHREYFFDCVGAIDVTHIPAMIPTREQGPWRNRKHAISQNVLAAVGHDMKFHYILVGWEGFASDARVLQNALTRQGERLQVPEGKYYVADCGYANAPGFLAPYRGHRYHLSTFRAARRPNDMLELFNHRHCSVRNVIERTFGLLKGRFPILKTAPPYSIKKQVKLVIACCVLHNHIMGYDHDETFMDSPNQEQDESHESSEEPFHNGAYGPPTQEEREAWKAFRDAFHRTNLLILDA